MAINLSQNEEILSSPFSVTPCLMGVTHASDGSTHIFHTFLGQPSPSCGKGGKKLMGSIVTNPLVKNASCLVLAMPGISAGQRSQRLLIKAVSPRAAALQKTIDFFPLLDTDSAQSSADGTEGPLLGMRITEGLHAASVDTAQQDGHVFPLHVGPGSAVIGSMAEANVSELTQLGIDWSNVFNIAKAVVPIVAKSGYDIYNQLNKPSSQNGTGDSVDGWISDLTQVAQIAAPIAGALLA